MEDPNKNERKGRSILQLLSISEEHAKIIKDLLENPNTTLDEDQEEALCEIISRYLDEKTGDLHVAQLLPADTGWGKTRVAIYVAYIMNLLFGMTPLIFCPANIRIQWGTAMKDFSLKALGIYSYEEIRGQRTGKQGAKCKHPYLTRGDGEFGPFYVTEQWQNELDKGIFLIVDESQKLKNESGQHFACIELINSLCNRAPVVSRMLHLTASFIDKPDNWKSLMRCFGYTKQTEMMMYNPGKGIMEYTKYGVGEIRLLAEKINKAETLKVFREYPLSASNLPNILHQLWVRIFRPCVVIPVVDPVYINLETGIPYKRIRLNGFYELDKEGQAKANDAILRLKRAHILRDDGFVDLRAANSKANFGLYQKALMDLCEAKLGTMVRLALADLRDKSCPHRKVILSIPFIAGQEECLKNLKQFGALVLNGSVEMSDRPDIIAKFNEANDDCRVIIITPSVGGVGISLHDTDGRFPVRMRLISDFGFLNSFQTTGRAYRRGLKSDVEIIFMYGANAAIESVLFNTMIKSKTCADVMLPGSNRIYPGEYDIYIENEHKYPELRKTLENMKKMSVENLKKTK